MILKISKYEEPLQALESNGQLRALSDNDAHDADGLFVWNANQLNVTRNRHFDFPNFVFTFHDYFYLLLILQMIPTRICRIQKTWTGKRNMTRDPALVRNFWYHKSWGGKQARNSKWRAEKLSCSRVHSSNNGKRKY